MAAMVIGSLSSPSLNRLSISASCPRKAAAASTQFGSGRLGLVNVFKGLRISRKRHHRRAASSGPATKRCGVVCEAQDTAVDVRDVTNGTWQSLVMECDKPVLVEFWAPWCGPCRMILPVIAKLSKTYEGKLECYKINTDECPDIASQYGIRSIPTIIIFKNGEKKDAVIGAVPETTLITSIEKFV